MKVLILCAQNKDLSRFVLYRYPSHCKSFIYHFYLTGDPQLEGKCKSLYPNNTPWFFWARQNVLIVTPMGSVPNFTAVRYHRSENPDKLTFIRKN